MTRFTRRWFAQLLVLLLLVLSLTLTVIFQSPKEYAIKQTFWEASMDGVTRKIDQKCPGSMKLEYSDYDKKLAKLSGNQPIDPSYYDNITYTDKVVILSPISSIAKGLRRYFQNICSLSYPHELLSVALGEDSSVDDTFNVALDHLHTVQKSFRRVKVMRSTTGLSGWRNWIPEVRHQRSYQLPRRSHLARARNNLLFSGLDEEDNWVLWVDSDVRYLPPDLIQRLLSAGKDIVVPTCMKAGWLGPFMYDKNTFKEIKQNDSKTIKRVYLDQMREEKHVVEIDAVGGCVLLIKADLHRNGLIFPTFMFRGHIETEGLAKMANSMGYKMYGMPYLEVYHETNTI